jgi:hypothetical protein
MASLGNPRPVKVGFPPYRGASRNPGGQSRPLEFSEASIWLYAVVRS